MKGTLRKKIRSYAMQSKKVKTTRKPNCFFCSCARKRLNQSRKGPNVWGGIKEGGRIQREDKPSRPRIRDPGAVQPGQPVTESKRSDSLELGLQRSALLEMANQEKTLTLTSSSDGCNYNKHQMVKRWYLCVCVNFLMEGRERREEVGTWVGRDVGVPRAEGTDPQVPS